MYLESLLNAKQLVQTVCFASPLCFSAFSLVFSALCSRILLVHVLSFILKLYIPQKYSSCACTCKSAKVFQLSVCHQRYLSCKLFEVGVADVLLKIHLNFYKADYIKDTAGDKKEVLSDVILRQQLMASVSP